MNDSIWRKAGVMPAFSSLRGALRTDVLALEGANVPQGTFRAKSEQNMNDRLRGAAQAINNFFDRVFSPKKF